MWFGRPTDLRALDARREGEPRWFQSQTMLGGVCYVDLFAGDLNGARKDPILKELADLPASDAVVQGAEGQNDGGYAVSSYARSTHRLAR
jgi:hypothetical protein